MTRPLTPVVAPYVTPVANQFASRARAYAVLDLVTDAFLGLGLYKLISYMHEPSRYWKVIAIYAGGLAIIAAFSIWRLKLASRAARVGMRAMDENLRFAFDTKRVGEVGPDGAIIAEMSVPITAEQFTHFLSMPRPQLAFQAPLPPARVNR
jgi:hypothetical protein